MTNKEIEFKNFIDSPNSYSRDNKIGHITSSCWILNKQLDSVLLTHHRKLNIWIPTGGHAESETEPISIAIREGVEETGLKLRLLSETPFNKDIHIIPQYKDVPKHKHFDFTYLFVPIGSEEFTVSEESHDLKWIPLLDIEKYSTEDNVIYMRDKSINLIKKGNITILE